PMAKGFVYLAAVMDWFSRRVLSWRLSITMEADFCVEAVQEAMAKHGRPEIFNTDQGVQFTSAAFLDELETAGVRISMDGKGRFLDNIFIERLWRSLKYEEVFIKAYGSVLEARRGIGGWLSFYNDERPHQALGYQTPRTAFEGAACEHVDNPSASLRDAAALPTCSQAQHQEKEVIYVLTHVEYGLYFPLDTPLGSGRGIGNAAGLSLKSPRFLSNQWGPPQALTDKGTKHTVYCGQCGGERSHDVPGATERFRAFFE